MSNLVFPSLPGLSIEMSRTPAWKSIVHESVSGCSVSASSMTYPKWKYRLQYEVLESGAEKHLQQLVGFFNRHGGRADTWLFFDEEDCVATDQQFGVGDGATTDFYLVRDLGGFIEPVTDIKEIQRLNIGPGTANSLVIELTRQSIDIGNGDTLTVSENEFSYAGNGRIQFTVAPAVGIPLIWSGTFYRRCRFDRDELDAERFLYQLWRAKTVEFTTDKGVG